MSNGAYGNDNLAYIKKHQFITYAGTSEQSAALAPECVAVDLYAATDCYVAIGPDPTAVAPGAEKTRADGFLLRADNYLTVAVPKGTEVKPMKIAVIQHTSGGDLDILERTFE